MTTLTLSQLRADLARIPAHDLAATNIIEVQHTAGGNVHFTTDTRELEAQLALALVERDEARRDRQALRTALHSIRQRLGDMSREVVL